MARIAAPRTSWDKLPIMPLVRAEQVLIQPGHHAGPVLVQADLHGGDQAQQDSGAVAAR
jgi:hypothetical protein